jgi:hypothetical protein
VNPTVAIDRGVTTVETPAAVNPGVERLLGGTTRLGPAAVNPATGMVRGAGGANRLVRVSVAPVLPAMGVVVVPADGALTVVELGLMGVAVPVVGAVGTRTAVTGAGTGAGAGITIPVAAGGVGGGIRTAETEAGGGGGCWATTGGPVATLSLDRYTA